MYTVIAIIQDVTERVESTSGLGRTLKNNEESSYELSFFTEDARNDHLTFLLSWNRLLVFSELVEKLVLSFSRAFALFTKFVTSH